MPKTQSKTKFQSTFGKREQGILKDPERCLNDEGPQLNDNVADNFKESENVTVMRDSKFRPCGLYVTGFIGQFKLCLACGHWSHEKHFILRMLQKITRRFTVSIASGWFTSVGCRWSQSQYVWQRELNCKGLKARR